MTPTPTKNHIRDLFSVFAYAIQLDQIRVDALPSHKFSFKYRDSMWRIWRRSHLDYINRLLPTVEAISPALLEKLTWFAINYEPEVVQKAALELFAEVAIDSYATEEVETASLFFGLLIQNVSRASENKPAQGDARVLMMKWLPFTDPLRISEDPESGYDVPLGLVN